MATKDDNNTESETLREYRKKREQDDRRMETLFKQGMKMIKETSSEIKSASGTFAKALASTKSGSIIGSGALAVGGQLGTYGKSLAMAANPFAYGAFKILDMIKGKIDTGKKGASSAITTSENLAQGKSFNSTMNKLDAYLSYKLSTDKKMQKYYETSKKNQEESVKSTTQSLKKISDLAKKVDMIVGGVLLGGVVLAGVALMVRNYFKGSKPQDVGDTTAPSSWTITSRFAQPRIRDAKTKEYTNFNPTNQDIATALKDKSKEVISHKGIDVSSTNPKDKESLVVRSPIAGEIIFVGDISGYGKTVKLFYPNVVVLFAHLSEAKVTKGQQVKKGDVIGIMGSTGNATGALVHIEAYEVLDKNHLSPVTYLNPEMYYKNLQGKKSVEMRISAKEIDEYNPNSGTPFRASQVRDPAKDLHKTRENQIYNAEVTKKEQESGKSATAIDKFSAWVTAKTTGKKTSADSEAKKKSDTWKEGYTEYDTKTGKSDLRVPTATTVNPASSVVQQPSSYSSIRYNIDFQTYVQNSGSGGPTK